MTLGSTRIGAAIERRLHTPEAIAARTRAEAQSAEARARAEQRAAAIDACQLCDHRGYRHTTDGRPGGVCDHNPERDAVNARGRALLAETRATLTARRNQETDQPQPSQADTDSDSRPSDQI